MTGILEAVGRAPARVLLLLWLLVGSAAPLRADVVDGAVRISADVTSPVWAGQQVTLNLDLMSTGFSFSDQQFLLPPVDGGFLLQTDSTTVKLTERRGEETWQVLRYPIALFPQRAGAITVPGFEVRFRAGAGYGSEPRQFAYRTQPVTLQVERPPGLADDALVVTTTRLRVDAAWSPAGAADDAAEVVSMRAGDAVSLTVRLQAADVSGMFLPGLPVMSVAGLSAYPESPVVADRVDRGRLEGSRVEKVTWVFAEPGRYEFPEIRYRWFDPQAATVRERLLAGRRFEVDAPPEARSAANPAVQERGRGVMWAAFGGACAVLAAAVAAFAWRRARAQARPRARTRGRSRGEPGAAVRERESYRAALRACRRDEATAAYAALLEWAALRAGGPVSLGAFASACEPDFRNEAEDLQRALVGGEGGQRWRGAALAAKLSAQGRSRRGVGRGTPALAPLNPAPQRDGRAAAGLQR